MTVTTALASGRTPARQPRLPPALRAYQYNLLSYKRTWRGSLTTTFLYPVLYLAAMGVGLGQLIDHGSKHAVEGVAYVWFLAPGLLAGTAMQIGANESTFPVMAGIKWLKTYLAMLATPLEVTDVLYGHLLWITTRVTMASAAFLGVMAAFHAVPSWWALAAFPAAVLTGAAFAAPVMAFSATRETDQSFIVLYRFGVVPLVPVLGNVLPDLRTARLAAGRGPFHAALPGGEPLPRLRARPTRRVGRRRPLRLSRGDAGGGRARGQGDVPAKAGAMTPSRTTRRR